MPSTKAKNRIEWIDAMRAVAIVMVLLSHYDGGKLSVFANRSCVQIFFFISGIFAFGGRYTLPQYVKKQAQSLLLPYGIFAVVNIIFHFIFNPSTPVKDMLGFALNFIVARRNEVMVAAMWFLPCLFFASILYKAMVILLKKQRYIVPVCFVISAVFKLWFESPVYIFSVNQGLKYLIYIALGGLIAPYFKKFKKAWKHLPKSYRTAALLIYAVDCAYILRLYVKGYVFWPKAIWALSLVYFLNVVMCIIFVLGLSMVLEKIKPVVWIGQNTLGFCCLENINRALLNTAMAVVGFGFLPDSEIKAFVHVMGAVCIGTVIIWIINRFCPQLFGKNKK